MNLLNSKPASMLIRYLVILLLGIPNLFLFYYIFTPLTVYPVLAILKLFGSSFLIEETLILFNSIRIEIVPACIAGAAYYLLLALNLTTPMKSKQRVFSLLFLSISFLIINILRIIIFALLYANGFTFFDLTHTATWYFGSTILLVLIWFSNIRLFKIKDIPIYTDFKYLTKNIRKTTKGKSK